MWTVLGAYVLFTLLLVGFCRLASENSALHVDDSMTTPQSAPEFQGK